MTRGFHPRKSREEKGWKTRHSFLGFTNLVENSKTIKEHVWITGTCFPPRNNSSDSWEIWGSRDFCFSWKDEKMWFWTDDFPKSRRRATLFTRYFQSRVHLTCMVVSFSFPDSLYKRQDCLSPLPENKFAFWRFSLPLTCQSDRVMCNWTIGDKHSISNFPTVVFALSLWSRGVQKKGPLVNTWHFFLANFNGL